MVDRVFDDYCMSGDKRVPCCVMYVPPAFIAYVIIWFISSIWTIFTLLEVRVFVIGGTMAQWYFAPSSEAVTCNANLGRTLKHAICNNFGSIAFAGAVMTLCNALRQLARKARDDGGIFGCILACILMCIVRFIEWLTKLTTISVAVTGEHFLASGKRTLTVQPYNNPILISIQCKTLGRTTWDLTLTLLTLTLTLTLIEST